MRNTTIIWFVFFCAACVFITGCIGEENSRFALDQHIGRASAGDASVSTDDGLALVHSFSRGSLSVRLLAPSVGFTLETGNGGSLSWSIAAGNMMPGSVCTAETPEEGFVSVSETPVSATSSVFAVTLQGGRSARVTIAPPDAASGGVFRFALLSDIQGTADRDIYASINADPSVRFLVSAGDLTENGDSSQFRDFLGNISVLDVPVYSAPGNHDLFSGTSAWHEHMGLFNSSFVFKGVRFTFADSSQGTIEPRVYDWLEARLSEGADADHVFITHIPPQDPFGLRGGAFANSLEAAKLLALLGRGRVDVTLYGHIHSYYAFTNAGIPAYISGGGGGIQGIIEPYGRHFLLIDASSAGIVSVTKIMAD